jgi:hypothetical protein
VKYFFASRTRGVVRGVGVRADGRIYMRPGGLDLDEEAKLHTTWAATGGVIVRF